MTTRQKTRDTGDVFEEPEPTTDAAEPTEAEIHYEAPTVEVLPKPSVGDWVLYQVQPGRLIPMLVTTVHWLGDREVDGVIFSASYRDVGNYHGTRPVLRVQHGDAPYQWTEK